MAQESRQRVSKPVERNPAGGDARKAAASLEFGFQIARRADLVPPATYRCGSQTVLATTCEAVDFAVPFLKRLQEAMQGFLIQGFELGLRVLLVRTFPGCGR